MTTSPISRFVLIPYEIYLSDLSNKNFSESQQQQHPPPPPAEQKLPVETQAKLLSIESRFKNSNFGKQSASTVPSTITELSQLSEVDKLLDSSLFHTFSGGKVEKCRHIVASINTNDCVSIDFRTGTINIEGLDTGVNLKQFLYDLQQPTKSLSENYEPILSLLKLPDYLVANTKAKYINSESTRRGGKRRWIQAF